MENKDEKLWAIAQKRASFKKEAFTYLVVNLFLWAIWFFTRNEKDASEVIVGNANIPWPVWVTLGWGVAVALKYFKVYKTNGDSLAEKEYEKLINKDK
jgi:hypothetical protein